MFPNADILLRPLLHGAVGYWDEILNLIPLVFGAGLLFYLYFGSRKRRAADARQHQASTDPARPPDEDPQA